MRTSRPRVDWPFHVGDDVAAEEHAAHVETQHAREGGAASGIFRTGQRSPTQRLRACDGPIAVKRAGREVVQLAAR